MNYRQFAQRIRVPSGFILAPLLFILARPTSRTFIAGALLAVAGLLVRAWASGYLRKNEELTTAGPYAHTRNPLYLGTFLLGIGVAVAGGSVWFLVLFMLFYFVIYFPVILAEAETMRRLFPESYPNYSLHVPLFLPRLSSHCSPSVAARFDPRLYFKHREYRATIGVAAVYALLLMKSALLSP